ncbi:MAG TPA: beta-ketoacyl-[acyl-carrier-protein] synthase family protein [Candidatus Limnocylindrales bacterium]|nr:beta-ketoacyl-[acyl-carrier-protein] synthase family protein [Candidatus Limnocylindrales bacterium]
MFFTNSTGERRVVVTGIGVISPNGIGKEKFWQAIRDGVSGVKNISLFDASDLPCQIAGEVPDFDFDPPVGKSRKNFLHRLARMALAAADEAQRDAKLNLESLSDEERHGVGVIVGTGAGGICYGEDQYRIFFQEGRKKVSPYAISASLAGMLSSEISIAFGLRGPSHVLSNGCTSSTDAIGYAFDQIRHGRSTLLLSGGAEACITPGMMAGFCRMGAVPTKWNLEPTRGSRPFNKDRDGFVLAEGAWILVLEELQHAFERGAFIYGEIVGYGSTCDAYHRLQIMPSGEESSRAIELALKDGGVAKEEVDYISLHGTATELNDRIETKAIKLCFGPRAYTIPTSALKSMIGHPQGASGAAGVVATLLSMVNHFIHPTINYENPDSECDLDYVPNVGRKAEIRTSVCNCIGFGSKNSALVLRKFEGL